MHSRKGSVVTSSSVKAPSHYMKSKSNLLLAAIVFLYCLNAGAETLEDSFSLNGRREGAKLDASMVEKGGSNWSASPYLIFTGRKDDGGYLTASDVMAFFARLPVAAAENTITISCDILPRGKSPSGAQWIAIGMGGDSGGSFLSWANGILLLITPSGKYEVLANDHGDSPETVRIAHGNIPNFSSESINTVSLTFNRQERLVDAVINGECVVNAFQLPHRYEPKISCAGLSGFGQLPNSAVMKNFKLSY